MHLLGITFIRVVAMSVSTLNTPVIFLSEAIASALRTSSPSRLRLNLSSATASVALNIYLCGSQSVIVADGPFAASR